MNKDLIINRYKNPKNWSEKLSKVNGQSVNASCGDEIYLSLETSNGKVVDCSYNGMGCSICLATADILLDEVKGKSIEDVKNINEQKVLELIGMENDSSRKRCAMLSLEAVKNSLDSVE